MYNQNQVYHVDSLELSHSASSSNSIYPYIQRFEYKKHYGNIQNTRQLKASIRAGKYCFPGGYEVRFLASDGDTLCYDCVKGNISNCIHSLRYDYKDGWTIVATFIDYGESDSCCANCNKSFEYID